MIYLTQDYLSLICQDDFALESYLKNGFSIANNKPVGNSPSNGFGNIITNFPQFLLEPS